MWLSARSSVRATSRSFRPDAVISYWAHPDGEAARRAATEMGAPLVLIVGGSDVLVLGQEPARRRSILGVLQSADGILAVGNDLRRRVIDLGVSPEKVFIFRRGVSDRFAPGDKDTARGALGLPLGAPTLLWVGNMVPVKGVHFLLDACARLERGGLPVRLYLVGDGPLREDLEAQAASPELAGRVQFVGSVGHDDLPDWYRAADLTVLPSLSEGVPNVLLESLACGTPFVASRVGGIPDLALEPEKDLVSPSDPAELATAIRNRIERDSDPAAPSPRFLWRDSAALVTAVVEGLRRPSASGG
jgi:glycosyltransferase involved in cell wall biosynthesis